ncbi:unnamed protein product [Trichobilharzia szidati]|nr:unnamed protein product [Trichobilharzia szidati]
MSLPQLPSSSNSSTTPEHQFNSLKDVHNVVQSILLKLAEQHQYTNPAVVQEELLQKYPNVQEYLKRAKLNVGNIPRLNEHSRLIQHVNLKILVYALLSDVLTLEDISRLIREVSPNDYHLLGPVTKLPVVLKIFKVKQFAECVENSFTVLKCKESHKNMRMSASDIYREFACRKPDVRKPGRRKRARRSEKQKKSSFMKYMQDLFGEDVSSQNKKDRFESLFKFGIRIKRISQPKALQKKKQQENILRVSTAAQEKIRNRINEIWSTIQDCSKKTYLGRCYPRKPNIILKGLKKLTLRLHAVLTNMNNLNILLFSEFIDNVVPLEALCRIFCMLIMVCDTSSLKLTDLVSQLLSSIHTSSSSSSNVIDLTGDSDNGDDNHKDCTDDTSELTLITNRVNQLLHEYIEQEMQSSKSIWTLLATLEEELLGNNDGANKENNKKQPVIKTLLSYLSEAVDKNMLVHASNIHSEGNLYQYEKEINNLSTEVDEMHSIENFNPHIILQFIQKLSCISLRSKDEVCKLVCENLQDIIPSTKLDNFITSILPKLITSDELNRHQQKALIYHDFINLQGIFINPHQSIDYQSTSSSSCDVISSHLLTQRDCVLQLLSACPSLEDLKVWCQWCQLNGLLLDRWGTLESFLNECGTDQVCNQFNLFAIRLLPPYGSAGVESGGQLLRLTAHPSPDDVSYAFKQWQLNCTQPAINLLCDYLIGTAINANSLSVEQVCSILKENLTTSTTADTDSDQWIYLVHCLLISLPFSLSGLVFSSIIIPTLELANIRSAQSWPLDNADISLKNSPSSAYSLLQILFDDILLPVSKRFTLSSLSSPSLDRQTQEILLISAIGNIGYQLKWPAYIQCFEEKRFQINHSKDAVSGSNESSCQKTLLRSSSEEGSVKNCEELDNGVDDESTAITKQCIADYNKASVVHKGTLDTLSSSSSPRQFIEDLRRREFGVGADLSEEAVDLLQRVEGKLSRSLTQLSEEIYGLPGHFLLELIQNADDNTYSNDGEGGDGDDEMPPTLEFHLSSNHSTDSMGNKNFSLYVMNNESVGFTQSDIAALCDIGQSTKLTQRDMKIGRKGIGFKSVFNITDTAEVHSNGFHIRFRRQNTDNQHQQQQSILQKPLLLLPEWCEEYEASDKMMNSEIPSWCRTLFILPLSQRITYNSLIQSPALQLIQLIQTTLKPNLLLFLRRLRCLTFSSDEPNIYWSVKRTCKTWALSLSSTAKCYAELITVSETERHSSMEKQKTTLHKWFCFKESIPVDDDIKDPKKNLPRETAISIAISLTDSEPLQSCPIFAYLPVLSVGFRFCINADFDLTSSREDINSKSLWNCWLVDKIPNVFADMIECIGKLPSSCFITSDDKKARASDLNTMGCTRVQLIGRIISCLPYNLSSFPSSTFISNNDIQQQKSTTIAKGDVFSNLSNKLLLKLSQLSWLPGIKRSENILDHENVKYVCASQLLVVPSSYYEENDRDNNNTVKSSNANKDLIHLLIDSLQVFEPHPDLFVQEQCTESIDDDNAFILPTDQWQDYSVINYMRMESLTCLGAQSISTRSLLNLAAVLKPDDIVRPGFLAVLMSAFDTCLSTQNASASSSVWNSQPFNSTSITMSKCHLVKALQHLPIFPLTNGNCVRLCDRQTHNWANNQLPLPILLPPHPSEIASALIGITYNEYTELIEKLGPLIKPNSVHRNLEQYQQQPQQDRMKVEYSSLLINKSPNGCNLQIAYPHVVFKEWILPYLKVINQLKEISSTQLMNWLITVGQFYACVEKIDNNNSSFNISALCDDEFPTMLPIITIKSGSGSGISENLLNEKSAIVMPALCNENGGIRKEAIFLPPDTLTTNLTPSASSTSSSSSSWKETTLKLEIELFNFLLNCKRRKSSDSSTSSSTRFCFYVISPKYFENYSSSDPRRHQRWLNLFSKAGVSTLFSIHKVKYLYQSSKIPSLSTSSSDENTSNLSSSGDVTPLPPNHRLYRCIHKSLSEKGLTFFETPNNNNNSENSMWLIEDYTAPGIELLLKCISITMFSATASVSDKQCSRQAAQYLASILHNDWLTYEAYSFASYKCVDARFNASNMPAYPHQMVYSSSHLPHTTIISSNTTYHLTYSSWFHKLRQTVWLPVEQGHTVQFTSSPYQLLKPPTDSQRVYSPSAFYQLELQNKQLAKLFKQNSYIWSIGSHIVKKSLNFHFMKSIGLTNNLGCSTIQKLMKRLGDRAKKANSACPACLTPDIMLEIYRIAIQYYLREQYHSLSAVDSNLEKSLNQWLQSIFANPAYPCILIQCPRTPTLVVASSTKSTCKRQRKTTIVDYSQFNDESNEISNDCPICCNSVVEKESSNKSSSQKKRTHTHVEQRRLTPTYHLVDIDSVCWQRIDAVSLFPAVLNANEEGKEKGEEEAGDNDEADGEVDCEEEDEFNHQHCLLSYSTPPTGESRLNVKTVQHPRIFSLSQCYDETSRHIFIDQLGLPTTSSIDEVLSLRPNLPAYNKANGNHKEIHEFGKRLANWYAALDYCIHEEYWYTEKDKWLTRNVNKSSGRRGFEELAESPLVAYVKQFPILLDSMGHWHKPCDVVTTSPLMMESLKSNKHSTSSKGRQLGERRINLFTWFKAMPASIIHDFCQSNSSQYRIMAYSLYLLNEDYPPLRTTPCTSYHARYNQYASSSSSSSSPSTEQYEGNTRNLLLNLFGLPILDYTTELCIRREGDYQLLSIRHIDHKFMIPHQLMDIVFKSLLRLILLWCSTKYSAGNNEYSTRSSIDQDMINTIVESNQIDAYIVEHLQIGLNFPPPYLNNFQCSSVIKLCTKHSMVCLLDGKLFLDKILGDKILSRLSSSSSSDLYNKHSPLIYLLHASINDPVLKNHRMAKTNNDTMHQSLIYQIIDFLCPYNGNNKMNLIQFLRGFLNLALSIHSNVLYEYINMKTYSHYHQQLESYLLSHGIRPSKVRHEMSILYPPPPPLPPASRAPPQTITPPSPPQSPPVSLSAPLQTQPKPSYPPSTLPYSCEYTSSNTGMKIPTFESSRSTSSNSLPMKRKYPTSSQRIDDDFWRTTIVPHYTTYIEKKRKTKDLKIVLSVTSEVVKLANLLTKAISSSSFDMTSATANPTATTTTTNNNIVPYVPKESSHHLPLKQSRYENNSVQPVSNEKCLKQVISSKGYWTRSNFTTIEPIESSSIQSVPIKTNSDNSKYFRRDAELNRPFTPSVTSSLVLY